MGDLISRKAALQEVLFRCNQEIAKYRTMRRALGNVGRAAYDGVKAVPAVDAVPVVHGRWIPVYEEMETLVGVYPYTQVREVLTGWCCSVCGRCEGLPREEMPYCHCGAKMDLEEE